MKRTILLSLALTMALAVTGCGSNGNTSSQNSSGSGSDATSQSQSSASGSQTAGEVMSYEEYMAAALDSQVTVETYVQAKQSWWKDKATLYTQDQDGAYFVYDAACSQELYDQLIPGTKIQVTGYKTEWSGEVEIIDASIQIVEGGDTFVAEPLDVTELLGADTLIDHEHCYNPERPYSSVFVGRRKEQAYQHSMEWIIEKYQGAIIQRIAMDPALAEAMGDEVLIARFPTEQQVFDFYADCVR